MKIPNAIIEHRAYQWIPSPQLVVEKIRSRRWFVPADRVSIIASSAMMTGMACGLMVGVSLLFLSELR